MQRVFPKDLQEATSLGLKLLDESSKAELASLQWVHPHTRYQTDYIEIVGSSMGLIDRSNKLLLEDIATNHTEQLHFLECVDGEVDSDAAVRVVLTAMSKDISRS
ncbi:hypothetical protein [Massilia sp. BJB1822]|uniref:hypothetical protein n=1 Tax=Massilia sp. BJB1822 TaxID=2744470 RepID=UPI001593A812|nr:hypothetical protein [Massilia sp. BJB1822]NVE01197.1 hypothetical protein [Massilia sp. BJB1822]